MTIWVVSCAGCNIANWSYSILEGLDLNQTIKMTQIITTITRMTTSISSDCTTNSHETDYHFESWTQIGYGYDVVEIKYLNLETKHEF